MQWTATDVTTAEGADLEVLARSSCSVASLAEVAGWSSPVWIERGAEWPGIEKTRLVATDSSGGSDLLGWSIDAHNGFVLAGAIGARDHAVREGKVYAFSWRGAVGSSSSLTRLSPGRVRWIDSRTPFG